MSRVRADNLDTRDGLETVPVSTVVNGTAKAWVNFNGTGTVAINRAFNVTSITDNGVGDYQTNFTNALPDTSYAVVANASRVGVTSEGIASPFVLNTTSCRVSVNDNASANTDMDIISVAVFS